MFFVLSKAVLPGTCLDVPKAVSYLGSYLGSCLDLPVGRALVRLSPSSSQTSRYLPRPVSAASAAVAQVSPHSYVRMCVHTSLYIYTSTYALTYT